MPFWLLPNSHKHFPSSFHLLLLLFFIQHIVPSFSVIPLHYLLFTFVYFFIFSESRKITTRIECSCMCFFLIFFFCCPSLFPCSLNLSFPLRFGRMQWIVSLGILPFAWKSASKSYQKFDLLFARNQGMYYTWYGNIILNINEPQNQPCENQNVNTSTRTHLAFNSFQSRQTTTSELIDCKFKCQAMSLNIEGRKKKCDHKNRIGSTVCRSVFDGEMKKKKKSKTVYFIFKWTWTREGFDGMWGMRPSLFVAWIAHQCAECSSCILHRAFKTVPSWIETTCCTILCTGNMAKDSQQQKRFYVLH